VDELLKPMTQLLKPVDESLASKIRPLERGISQNALFFNNPACFTDKLEDSLSLNRPDSRAKDKIDCAEHAYASP
jgi:hypothetical protein